MRDLLVAAVQISKTYRMGTRHVHALRDVSLEIRAGEFVSIVGPSGSGKSTLLSIAGLLDRPTAGQYFFGGVDVSRLAHDSCALIRSRKIGVVFQNFSLLNRNTALENAELPLVYAGVPKSDRALRATAALRQVGLGERGDHWPSQLSGGEQQRVAIARALANDPALILADEPTGALDSANGSEVMAQFRALNENGRTIVIVTHDREVARWAKRVITMQDGRIVADSACSERRRPHPIHGLVNVTEVGQRFASTGGTHIRRQDVVRIAVRAAGANVFRTVLAMLGIVIGAAAVIAMTAIGSGAQEQVSDRIRSLGTNVLLVSPGSSKRDGVRSAVGALHTLTDADASYVAEHVPGVIVAAPMVSGPGQLVYGNRNWSTVVGGITHDYLIARDWSVQAGRSFVEDEVASAAKVVLLGATAARRLFEEENPLDKLIRIGNVPFMVIGILAEKGQAAAAGRDQDDLALIPISTAKLRVIGGRSKVDRRAVELIMVKAQSELALPSVIAEVRAVLRQLHKLHDEAEDDFLIREPSAVMEAQAAATRTLTILLGAIASVSLLVGGIGIMNVMLVSVAERTREIGLRQALGARRRDIRSQFLTEAVLLCLLGGIAGIVFGVVAAVLIARVAGWAILLNPTVIALGFAFSAGVGLFFGLYPACRAAKLNLVDAVRSE
jgi:macrolide transport system ATP-binding/permease protein